MTKVVYRIYVSSSPKSYCTIVTITQSKYDGAYKVKVANENEDIIINCDNFHQAHLVAQKTAWECIHPQKVNGCDQISFERSYMYDRTCSLEVLDLVDSGCKLIEIDVEESLDGKWVVYSLETPSDPEGQQILGKYHNPNTLELCLGGGCAFVGCLGIVVLVTVIVIFVLLSIIY